MQEELKKLYSQLEIYKRKKMLANNPHLPKKRSSKKGLGRSLMRRITEIPESVHRQCSREDKEAGEHTGNRNSICTLKKNPFDPAHAAKPAKEETLKSKVFSLKKSHSSYDHVRDQSEDSNGSAADRTEAAATAAEGSLLDTLMGKKMAKKSAENVNAPSESTESVPLVCKSASAHNLSADKKAIHGRASMLQKSLSVIASAKEKTLGLTTKAQSCEESSKKPQPKSRVSAEPGNEAQPKALEGKPNAAKGRTVKQPVAGNQPPTCSDLVKGKDLYDLSEVCPWEVEDLPTPSENKVQKHVSIAPKESTTIHGRATKAGRAALQKQKASEQLPSTGRRSAEPPKTAALPAELCLWEDQGKGPESSKHQSLSQPSRAATSQQPQPAAEAAKSSRVDVCPWDFPEAQKTADCSADTAKQRKSTSPVEPKGRSAPPEPPRAAGSLQIPPARADVCPWEFDSTAGSPSSGQRTPSPSQSSRAKEAPSKKKDSPSRTAEKEKPKEAKEKCKPSEKQQQKLAEVCPWDVDSNQETPAVEKRRSANVGAARAKSAEVCPWDFQDTPEKTDRAAKPSNPNPAGGVPSTAKKADICPWDFEDSTSSKKA